MTKEEYLMSLEMQIRRINYLKEKQKEHENEKLIKKCTITGKTPVSL